MSGNGGGSKCLDSSTTRGQRNTDNEEDQRVEPVALPPHQVECAGKRKQAEQFREIVQSNGSPENNIQCLRGNGKRCKTRRSDQS